MRKRILMILAVFTVSISGCAGTKDLTTTLEFDTQQKSRSTANIRKAANHRQTAHPKK